MSTTCCVCGTTPNIHCCEFGIDTPYEEIIAEVLEEGVPHRLPSQKVQDLMFTPNFKG